MRPIGAKGLYAEWLTEDGLSRIEAWARDGLTDIQIAHNMGIKERTFSEWKGRFDAIRAALKKGKAPVDLEVENALLKRALGYQYEETTTEIHEIPTGRFDADGKQIMRQVRHIRKTQKTALPDTTAQIFWLKNRKPKQWRERVEAAHEIDTEPMQALLNALNGAARTEKDGDVPV